MTGTRIEPGTLIVAKVSRIEDYGVFFDYDGEVVFVLITEMTDGVVDHPSSLVSVEEKVQLRILGHNEEKEGYAATMLV